MSYKDPIKDLARDKLRDFIARNLDHKKPDELRVLCFPGAEKEGEEGLELRIYDELGIPRENIVGLEKDRDRARMLRDASTGITVFRKFDYELFERTDRHFDIVSLDYTSCYHSKSDLALLLLAARRILHPKGVLCTNYLKGRDKSAVKFLELSSHFSKARDMHDFIGEDGFNPAYFEHVAKDVNGRRMTGTRISSHRSSFIRQRTANLFEGAPWICRTTKARKRALNGRMTYRDEDTLVAEQRVFNRMENNPDRNILFPAVMLSLKRPYLLDGQESYAYQRRNARSKMYFDLYAFDEYPNPIFDDAFDFDKKAKLVTVLEGVDIDAIVKEARRTYARLHEAKKLVRRDRIEIRY